MGAPYSSRVVLITLLGLGSYAAAWGQTTWYVDDDALGGGVGLSWNTAFTDVQAALDVAVFGDEIRVAGGRYVPTVRSQPADPRTETFALVEGVALRGGFAGLADPTAPDRRDLVANASILSGDLLGNDGPAGNDENVYHVVTATALTSAAILDGFTISGGNAHAASPNSMGGGMYVSGGAPRIENNVFLRNKGYYGGGIYLSASDAEIVASTFQGNDALVGGGVFAHQNSAPSLYNCRLVGNNALYGGAVCIYGLGTAVLGNCTLVANNAYFGGAVFNYNLSSTEATNCVLWDNTWNTMDRDDTSEETLTFCDVTDGWDGQGNVAEDPSLLRAPSSGPDSVWGTSDDDYGDVHLMPGSPCIDAGSNAGVPAGVTIDCAGNARRIDDPDAPDTGVGVAPIVDIGAYEFVDCNANGLADDIDLALGTSLDCNENHVPDACDIAGGTSLDVNGNGIPDECEGPICVGDFNLDGRRDLSDLAHLLGHYGETGVGYEEGDLTGDGVVDVDDLAALLAIYGVPCPT